MSPWLAVAVASVLVLRLAGVALPNELRRFSEFQYCDLEDRLNAAWLHSFRICLPLEAQLSFLSACAQVLCQFPDSTVQFTLATVLEDTRQGGLPWTWLIHFGPSLARAFPCPCCHGVCHVRGTPPSASTCRFGMDTLLASLCRRISSQLRLFCASLLLHLCAGAA